MATVVTANRSEFVNQVIKHYSENRVGQFSKYLDTDPMFITYYAVNMAQSRADIGTDAIEDVLGPESPIRFNKILRYPIFIKGGLEPDTTFENGQISSEIDINDITILPNTLVPRPFDHILIEVPNMIKVLLRVNSYKDITIQSNDFYSASAHAIRFGDNCAADIERLVVETYECIFENIGTQNSCFILSKDYNDAAALKATVDELKSIYNSIYYDPDVNSYIYNEEFFSRHRMVDPSVDIRQENRHMFSPDYNYDYDARKRYGVPNMGIFDANPFPIIRHDGRKRYKRCFSTISTNIKTQTVYDLYLTKFIKDSGVFTTTDNYDVTSALTYEDFTPHTFEIDFKRTLWYAVLSKSTTLLMKYPYHYLAPIMKEMSNLILKRYPRPSTVTLVKNASRHCECNGLSEYFSHELINDLKNGRKSSTTECNCTNDDYERDYVDVNAISENPDKDFNRKGVSLKEYSIETNEEEITEEDTPIKVFNDIIYAYFTDTNIDIDADNLLSWSVEPSLYMYEYMPIIIYILNDKYTKYFKKIS